MTLDEPYEKNLDFTKLDNTIIICAIVQSSSCNNSMAGQSRNKFISWSSGNWKTNINADPISTESPLSYSIMKTFCCVLILWKKFAFLELPLLRALILFVIITSSWLVNPQGSCFPIPPPWGWGFGGGLIEIAPTDSCVQMFDCRKWHC